MMNPPRKTHTVQIAGVQRELPLFQVAPKLSIAVLNLLGDTELVQACAGALKDKLAGYTYDLLVTPEAKSIPLAHALSVETQKPYVVRKNYKFYMGVALMSRRSPSPPGQADAVPGRERPAQQSKRVWWC
jgi:adenine phosphoribosyltransferase